MPDDVDLTLLGTRIEELLRLAREHSNQFVATGDRLAGIEKHQRHIDMRLVELADEAKVHGAILARLEHSLGHAITRLSERLETLER